jgi:polyisoprenoid-binding protein YceI
MRKILSLMSALVMTTAGYAASAAETTYTVDTVHTIPMFEVGHLGLSKYVGRFDKVSGTVTLDPEKKTGSVEIAIDAASISTDLAKLNEHLMSRDYLDVAQFPTITFKSSNIKFRGGKVVEIAGDLTLHGVTKAVTFKVAAFNCTTHYFRKVPACGADASATIKRTAFGIVGPYAPPVVGDEVTLRIQIEGYKS